MDSKIQPHTDSLRVLFVDDEQGLLDGLRRSLHRRVGNWELKFVDNGKEALEMMRENPFDVIVSDMRMPGMDGVELLDKIRTHFPNTIRFVLSGFSDRQMILKSVGLTHQFFSKPCVPEHLIHAIEFSASLYKHLNSSSVQKVICDIKCLPTPPVTYTEMTRELNGPDPSIEKLSELVMHDSAISARVLQMVNSAFFGIGRSVSDIEQATMFLGVENLRSLVLIIGMSKETFSTLRNFFDLDLYTHHSVEVGSISQEIAKRIGWSRNDSQVAFTAGLLHDMGKLIMATHFDKTYMRHPTFSMHTPDTEQVQELENETFGINHAHIGAALLALWGIPPKVVNAVAYHHKPQDDVVQGVSLSTIIHVANAAAYLRKLDEEAKQKEMPKLISFDFITSIGIEEDVRDWLKSAED